MTLYGVLFFNFKSPTRRAIVSLLKISNECPRQVPCHFAAKPIVKTINKQMDKKHRE